MSASYCSRRELARRSTATESKRACPKFPLDNVLLQQSQNVLAGSLLVITHSFLGVKRLRQESSLSFRKLFAGSHSLILPPRSQSY